MQVVWLVVIFAENGLGDDIFFSRPVPQVLELAALAAKREFVVFVGVSRFLANRTTVSHGPTSLSVLSVNSVVNSL
jgi:hypothetical protein